MTCDNLDSRDIIRPIFDKSFRYVSKADDISCSIVKEVENLEMFNSNIQTNALSTVFTSVFLLGKYIVYNYC